ncbi:MAG: cell division protein ZapA [Rhodothermales bacterium]
MSTLEKPLRVRILEREYALRISKEDESHTVQIATYLDAKMRAFRKAHPDQSEVTTAVITALAVTEELFAFQERHEDVTDSMETRLNELDDILSRALKGPSSAPSVA